MATAGAKVFIACKVAVPKLLLRICAERDVSENTQTGPRTIKQWFATGKIIQVRGTAYPASTPPPGFPSKPLMIDGAAVTPGVDKDLWDEWLSQNQQNPMVVNGQIKGEESLDRLRGFAKERRAELSGLEPIRPDRDARLPRSQNPGVSNVQTEETRRGKIATLEDAA